LVAARCVPIAIGGDIGGSLRFPAYFTGVYGFKPSTYRLSKRGLVMARKIRFTPSKHLAATPGPLGSTVDDLVVGMKVHSAPNVHRFDPFAAPCPWND